MAFDVNLRQNLWEGVQTARGAMDVLLTRGASVVLVSTGCEGAFYAARRFRGSLPRFDIDGGWTRPARGTHSSPPPSPASPRARL